MAKMTVLSVSNLSKFFGSELIFENVTFSLLKSEKCALVGRNGAGKTTLFNIIAGIEDKDGGEVAVSRASKISYKQQEIIFQGTIFEFMLDEHKELKLIEEKMEKNPSVNELEILMKRYEENGGYTYKATIKSVLKALGFEEDVWSKNVSELSGGELERLKLARVLSSNADILLLDEPTNHLDIIMISWLENFLKSTDKTVFFISHDIKLLENVATSVVSLFNRTCKKYSLNYLRYKEQFEKEIEEILKTNELNAERISKYEEFVRKYRAGIKSGLVKSRQIMIENLKNNVKDIALDRNVNFRIETSQRQPKVVISFQDVDLGYEYPILKGLNFDIYRGDKVGIIGKNGAGKSTLVKGVLNELSPIRGEIKIGENIKIGYFDQKLNNLNFENTLYDEIFYNENISSANEVYSIMARFGFEEDDGDKKVGVLSGGEKTKLSIIKLILEKPNLLILDEPTNHLDTDTVYALKNALIEYNGALLVVSHDRFFLEGLTNKSICLFDEKYYTDIISVSEMIEKFIMKTEKTKDNIREKPISERKVKVNTYKLNEIERRIKELENRIDILHRELNETTTDWEKINLIHNEIEKLEEELLLYYDEYEMMKKGAV